MTLQLGHREGNQLLQKTERMPHLVKSVFFQKCESCCRISLGLPAGSCFVRAASTLDGGKVKNFTYFVHQQIGHGVSHQSHINGVIFLDVGDGGQPRVHHGALRIGHLRQGDAEQRFGMGEGQQARHGVWRG